MYMTKKNKRQSAKLTKHESEYTTEVIGSEAAEGGEIV